MGILATAGTRVLVQGLTGREGTFHSEQMLAYGTELVGGVTPGKGGTEHLGVPVFDSVAEAVSQVQPDATCIFVPAAFAAQAICEAADASLPLIICITEGIPVADMVRAVAYVQSRGCRLIGPNCPGLLTAGQTKIGIIPGHIAQPGRVGVISRSGTLTYEVVAGLTKAGLGLTTCAGIGGDPILGSRFADLLPLFDADAETEAVVMIGEIGGTDEEDAAPVIAAMGTPVVGFISGRSAPEGKRMGHAGAIVSGGKGTAQSKVEALGQAGVPVPETIADIVGLVQEALAGRG